MNPLIRPFAWLAWLLSRTAALLTEGATALHVIAEGERGPGASKAVPSSDSQLEAYGRPLFTYRGEGNLRWAGGATKDIAFEVGQYPNGRIVLAGRYHGTTLADAMMRWGGGETPDPPPESFDGLADGGLRLRCVSGITPTNYLPKMHVEGDYDAFRLTTLDCDHGAVGDSSSVRHRFGLVNFRFSGTCGVTIERLVGQHHLRGLPVQLPVGSSTLDAVVVPVVDADSLHRMVMTQKTSAVLAELVVEADSGIDADQLANAVSDLCVVLSVMRGTKVQWIYRQDWSGRHVVRTMHRAGLTKTYSPLAPLDYEHESAADSARFIKTGLAALSTSAILKADRSVIDAYLDAKAEHDFLETRAAKVALALEKLKHLCLESGALDVGEFRADIATFRAVVPKIVSAALPLVADAGIPRDVAKAIISEHTVGGLNRTSFRHIVKALLAFAGLDVPKSELGLFIACRNCLVHVGRFYCQAATAEQRAQDAPLATPFEEYCFMISFLDRIFLKLFGYSGQYFDWRDFPAERRRRQLL